MTTLEARHLTKSRKTLVHVDKMYIVGGGAEEKLGIEGHVEGPASKPKNLLQKLTGVRKSRKVSLIERESLRGQANIAVTWRLLKKAGLPVVPTLRLTNRDTLLVTDVKADGSEVYGKATAYLADGGMHQRLKKGLSSVDRQFLSDFPTIRPQIVKACEKLAQQAAKAVIDLPYDDPAELLFHPDGSWQLIILDLSFTNLHLDDAWRYHGNASHTDDILVRNRKYLETLLKYLDTIYQKFSLIKDKQS